MVTKPAYMAKDTIMTESVACCEKVAMQNSSYSVEWTLFIHNGRELRLHSPLHVDIRETESGVTIECDTFSLMGYGKTMREAVGAFNDDFCVTYDEIAKEADKNLSADAKEWKAILLVIAGKV